MHKVTRIIEAPEDVEKTRHSLRMSNACLQQDATSHPLSCDEGRIRSDVLSWRYSSVPLHRLSLCARCNGLRYVLDGIHLRLPTPDCASSFGLEDPALHLPAIFFAKKVVVQSHGGTSTPEPRRARVHAHAALLYHQSTPPPPAAPTPRTLFLFQYVRRSVNSFVSLA